MRDSILPSEADYILMTEAILVGQNPLYFMFPKSASETVLVYPLAIVSITHALLGRVTLRSYGEIIRFGYRFCTSYDTCRVLIVGLTGQK